jgi:hypothetical protein
MLTFITFILGVTASFAAWLIVAAALRPRLDWQDDLSPFGGGDTPWFYAGLRNRRPWTAVDVHVFVRLRVRGLYKGYPRLWATFDLPLDDPYIPVLPGTLRSKRAKASRLKTIVTGGARQRFRVLTYRVELPERLRRMLPAPTADLDLAQVLTLGTQAELYFIAIASDGLSGTRGAFISRRFTKDDLPEDAPSASTLEEPIDGST